MAENQRRYVFAVRSGRFQRLGGLRMSSTFGGLEAGKSALNAFRLGMQTVGHNISNMNTEGYSRQRVIFASAKPEDIAHVGQLGQGMYASTIERIRDEFLDFQFRDGQAALGYWEKISDLYDSIQNYIPEPNASGLRTSIDTFFTDMQALQRSPEDTSARRAVVEAANSIGGMLDNLVSNFNTYNESINMEIKTAVDEANQMLYDLAALNQEIATAEALDQNANDLYEALNYVYNSNKNNAPPNSKEKHRKSKHERNHKKKSINKSIKNHINFYFNNDQDKNKEQSPQIENNNNKKIKNNDILLNKKNNVNSNEFLCSSKGALYKGNSISILQLKNDLDVVLIFISSLIYRNICNIFKY